MTKKELRQQMTERLKKLSKPEYEQKAYQIAETLSDTVEWQQNDVIGITVSRFPEVDTWQLIRRAWEQNKNVAVPKCHPQTKMMSFHKLERFTQLEESFFGLFEPIEDATEEIPKESIGLLLVPGLIYNAKGYRVGFGGGYYDRFLAEFSGDTISLAFSCQLVDKLPIEKHDIPVSKVITEEEILHTHE